MFFKSEVIASIWLAGFYGCLRQGNANVHIKIYKVTIIYEL